MPQKPTCFISYAWESEIDEFLVYLKHEIQKQSQNKVNVILDRSNFDIGENFKEKEKQILKSDLILVFLTPEYKQKVDMPVEHSGCFREFELILEKQKEDERFIYPILFRGRKEYSVPRDFRNNIYNTEASKIEYVINKKKGFVLEQHSRGKVNKLVEDIIKKTKVNYTLNDIRYIDLSEKYQALLKNTAADGTLKRSCMIKMPAYNAVITQGAYFVIGRKGSGKTTLLETIEKLDPEMFIKRYKILSPINAEDINIDAVYSCVEQFWNDKNYISIREITDLYWEVFFVVEAAYIVGLEVENNTLLSNDYRYKDFKKVTKVLREKLGLTKGRKLADISVKKQLPTLVAEIIDTYFRDHILDKSNESAFMTSIKTNLSVQNIMETFMGVGLFEKFINAFGSCQKKILISLDGFDTHSEDFRRITTSIKMTNLEEYSKRNEFENLFYRSLVNVVTRFKKETYNNSLDLITPIIDFCIVLPQDRLDQIKGVERDIAKVKFCGLFWDAYDLLKMLVLRLEEYYEIEPRSYENMLQRFYSVLDQKLSQIPHVVNIVAGDREYEFDLFNYMLRLSLWRPRDILLHFISLLELVENCENVGLVIDGKMVKDALAQTARKIIDEEFIQEYQNVFYNLKDVLNCLGNRENILTISETFNLIDTIKFDASFSYDCNNSKNKILILYQLGILGLRFDKNSIERRGYTHHICFYFNEGLSPIYDTIIDRDTISNEAEVVINPLLCKRFNISINTAELLCNYEWEYIEKLAAEKTLKKRF